MELNREEDETREKSKHISIHIDEDDDSSLAAHILAVAAASYKSSSLCSIYRVPTKMRHGRNQFRFDPEFVSIGPYHYKTRTFKFTENHKSWYLQDLISRSKTTNILKDIIKAIKDLEVEARECYAEISNLSSDEFVTMMVVDGCFILELLYKFKERVKPSGSWVNDSSDDTDPAFHGDGSVYFGVRRDIILLENQLPMLVLNCLFELTRDPNHNCSLNELIFTTLVGVVPRDVVSADFSIKSGKHILDLLRSVILGSKVIVHTRRYTNWVENNATDLREVGIVLKAKENATSSLDITFSEDDGVLEIPKFYFGEGMDTLIPNIIALEQSDIFYSYQITSYAFLLKTLVKSEHDVCLLDSGRIIDAQGNKYSTICSEITDICYGALYQPFYYDDLCNHMDSYRQSDWRRFRRMLHKWKVMLKRDYFSSPWAVISFSAAVVLLLLTLTQTIYSIKSYSPGD